MRPSCVRKSGIESESRIRKAAAVTAEALERRVCLSVSFQPRVDWAAGANPCFAASADFNGDGKLDLAVPNNTSPGGSVAILLGAGGGTFAAPTFVPAGERAVTVGTGDFNGDGKTDMAIGYEISSGAISIRIGNGVGGFGAATDVPFGDVTYDIDPIDVNKDGKLDLLATKAGNDKLTLALGNGNGTFAAPIDFAAGDAPYGHDQGDFNGDGNLDVATTSANDGSVSILLGSGTGNFSAPLTFAAGSDTRAVNAADLNGDGKLDLAVSDYSGAVKILLGVGNGTFNPPISYAAAGGAWAMVVSDFNGDGTLDVATSNQLSSSVSVLEGTGAGTFAAPVNLTTTFDPIGLVAADLNNDGRIDLAVSQFNANNSIGIFLNDQVVPPPPAPTPGTLQLVPDPNFPGKTAIQIVGTAAKDTIELDNNKAGGVKVKVNGKEQGTFIFDGAIYIYGGDGNDKVDIDANIAAVSFVFGEGGNDELKGGGGSSVVVGGAGIDTLKGNASRDILIGGAGVDKFEAGGDDDVIIAGGTVHDANSVALGSLLKEWRRLDVAYAGRVNNLRNGGGLNGAVRLDDPSLIADGQVDNLKGQAGNDLFFANTLGPASLLDQTDRLLVETIFQLA